MGERIILSAVGNENSLHVVIQSGDSAAKKRPLGDCRTCYDGLGFIINKFWS